MATREEGSYWQRWLRVAVNQWGTGVSLGRSQAVWEEMFGLEQWIGAKWEWIQEKERKCEFFREERKDVG